MWRCWEEWVSEPTESVARHAHLSFHCGEGALDADQLEVADVAQALPFDLMDGVAVGVEFKCGKLDIAAQFQIGYFAVQETLGSFDTVGKLLNRRIHEKEKVSEYIEDNKLMEAI